jgi:hypothetical protein
MTYSDKDSNPCGTIDTLVPESNDESTGNDLIRTDDEVFAKVNEGGSETESGVDTSSSVSSESLLGRESSRHFSKSKHDCKAAVYQSIFYTRNDKTHTIPMTT